MKANFCYQSGMKSYWAYWVGATQFERIQNDSIFGTFGLLKWYWGEPHKFDKYESITMSF